MVNENKKYQTKINNLVKKLGEQAGVLARDIDNNLFKKYEKDDKFREKINKLTDEFRKACKIKKNDRFHGGQEVEYKDTIKTITQHYLTINSLIDMGIIKKEVVELNEMSKLIIKFIENNKEIYI